MPVNGKRAGLLAALSLAAACGRAPAAPDDADLGAVDLGRRAELDLAGSDAVDLPCVPGTAVQPYPEACTHPECVQVLRLDYQTLAPKGFATLGGPPAPDDPAAAKQTAEQFLLGKMQPTCPTCAFHVEPRTSGAGVYLFEVGPLDFGGFAMISSRTGQLVAAGSIWWMGVGEWWFPAAWKPGAQVECGDAPSIPGPWGVVEYGACRESDDGRLPSFQQAIAVAARTNVALGMQHGGSVDVYAYLYTPSTGSCDPRYAEYVIVFSYTRK